MRLAVLALIGVGVMPGSAMGWAPTADVFDVWAGSCSANSQTADAEGRSPYPCNALLRIALAADPGHEQLIFVIKGEDGKQNGVMLSFGGRIDANGVLQVERVQFKPGKSTPMERGSACILTRDGEAIKRVQCNATASNGSGRSATIDFAATGKARLERE